MIQLPLFPADAPRFEILTHPHVAFDGLSPIVEGTRILVRRLWWMHQRGEPVAEIAERYRRVPLAAILSALAFAYDNRALIEWDEARASAAAAEAPPR